jgi:hypothetical protein
MEAEDSLPASQKPATYHTLNKINAVQDLKLFNKKNFNIILPSMLSSYNRFPFSQVSVKKKLYMHLF